jgi:glutamine amidotransferase
MIGIINYGMGNLGSIYNMLKKIRAEAMISSDPSKLEQTSKLILPGVGAFDNGMRNLEQMGLVPFLNEMVLVKKTPILGICLGMQLFAKKSEEGDLPGLGWIDAEAVRFEPKDSKQKLLVPHMGWNLIEIAKEHKLFDEMFEEIRFYFVHSFYVQCNDPDDTLAKAYHGRYFSAAIAKENLIGVQFHPEKSHKFGMKLMKNFVELC